MTWNENAAHDDPNLETDAEADLRRRVERGLGTELFGKAYDEFLEQYPGFVPLAQSIAGRRIAELVDDLCRGDSDHAAWAREEVLEALADHE